MKQDHDELHAAIAVSCAIALLMLFIGSAWAMDSTRQKYTEEVIQQ